MFNVNIFPLLILWYNMIWPSFCHEFFDFLGKGSLHFIVLHWAHIFLFRAAHAHLKYKFPCTRTVVCLHALAQGQSPERSAISRISCLHSALYILNSPSCWQTRANKALAAHRITAFTAFSSSTNYKPECISLSGLYRPYSSSKACRIITRLMTVENTSEANWHSYCISSRNPQDSSWPLKNDALLFSFL